MPLLTETTLNFRKKREAPTLTRAPLSSPILNREATKPSAPDVLPERTIPPTTGLTPPISGQRSLLAQPDPSKVGPALTAPFAPVVRPPKEREEDFRDITRGSVAPPKLDAGAVTKPPKVVLPKKEPAKEPAKVTEPEKVIAPEEPSLIDNLRAFASESLTATEDPNSTRIFNRAMTRIGLFNQAQQDMLQMQINQDPSLSGQRAGDALMGMLSVQQGFQVSDLVAQLSVEAANRVRDLNQWGFEKAFKIWDYEETQKANIRQEMLAAGDIDGFAAQFTADTGIDIDVQDLKELSPETQAAIETQLKLMDKALRAGNIEAARAHFETVTGLAPNMYKGADFDSLGFADDSYIMQSEMKEEIEGTVRLNIAQGDWGTASEGIKRLFPDETIRIDNGRTAIDTKTIGEINDILSAVGKDPITDKDDLIGLEDEFFVDSEISRIKSDYEKNIIDVKTKDLITELGNQGYDTTDPTLQQSVRSWVFDLEIGGYLEEVDGEVRIREGASIPPWDENSLDAHLFTDWPVLGADGEIIDAGDDPYGPTNPKPDPDSERGKYYADLDQKWESYLRTTSTEDRVPRETWFSGTKAGTVPYDEANVEAGLLPEGPTKFGTIEDLQKLTPQEWADMTNEDMIEAQKIIPTFSGQVFNRTGDFVDSGLKADFVYEREGKKGTKTERTEYSAGANEGSLVMYQGEIYRIVQYYTFKEGGKRTSILYGEPVAGGPGVRLSETTFNV